MVDVRIEADCGNAPKRQVLADYTVALAGQDIETVLAALEPDVQWDRIGVRLIHGTDEVAAELRVAFGWPVSVLRIDTVLTHGKAGSVSGIFTSGDDHEVAFCDIYEFAGHSKTAKIKKITSYWIPLVAA